MSSSTFITEFLRSGLSEAECDQLFAQSDEELTPVDVVQEDPSTQDCATQSDQTGDTVQSEAA